MPFTPTSVTTGNWGSLQVLVGPNGGIPTDVTFLRNVPCEVQSWSSSDPFGDAAAAIRFPQITPFDTIPGTGDLAWLAKFNKVAILKVAPDGVTTTTLWEGLVTGWDVEQDETRGGLTVTCMGALYQIGLFRRAPGTSEAPNSLDDIFLLQFNNSAGIRPSLQTGSPVVEGGPTGIESSTKAAWQSILEYLTDELAKAVDAAGRQWTILMNRPRIPVLKVRDTTTVDWTITAGTPGLTLRLHQDYQNSPNTIYGEAVDQTGSLVRNLFLDATTGSPFFEPFAFDPDVHNIYVNEGTGILYSSGSIDTSVARVERFVKFGEGIDRDDCADLAQQYLDRDADPGWNGTLTLRIDPEEGSRFEIAAGDNIKLKHFAGLGATGVLLHIAGCQVDLANLSVTLTVDSKARDLLALEDIIRRNRAGTSPGRQIRAGRSSGVVVDDKVPWDNGAGAGWVPTQRKFDGTSTVTVPANTWTVVKWLAMGGPGTVIRTEARASVSTQFGLYVFDWNINSANLPSDPFAHVDTWANPPVGYIVGWGVKNQRAGYSPGAETRLDDDGEVINTDAVTGVLLDETPWDIPARRGSADDVNGSSAKAAQPPFLYAAFYSATACTIWVKFDHGIN